MGPGHFGIALAVKTADKKVPLLVYLAASELLDILALFFVALKIEQLGVIRTTLQEGVSRSTPGHHAWSHSLFMSVIWSLIAGVMGYLIYKDRRAASLLGLVVFSHWVLDFIVHPPNLPLSIFGSTKVGLGLWSTGPGMILSMGLEIVLLAGGIAFYLKSTNRE
jgi:membrane-bound metal-dependent hydrolase YbcI (DUF457 family)